MKLPHQVQAVDRTTSATPFAAMNGVEPSLAALTGLLGGGGLNSLINTGFSLVNGIGCPIACARNDKTAIRALNCQCGG